MAQMGWNSIIEILEKNSFIYTINRNETNIKSYLSTVKKWWKERLQRTKIPSVYSLRRLGNSDKTFLNYVLRTNS